MADKTTNYNLTKPSADDFYDIGVHNANMDIIDDELKNLNDGKAPSGHGLGKQAVGIGDATMLKALSRGGGFYQIKNATDTPAESPDWIGLFQLSRVIAEDQSSGFQIAAFDHFKNNPQMWFRTIINNETSAWNEMLHTGNISNYTPKVATGTYVGTGKTKSANPNVLTFGFTPKILFVYSPEHYSYRYYEATFLYGCPDAFVRGFGFNSSTSDCDKVQVTWSANSVSWYNDTAEYGHAQLNDENTTYYYVAIG